MVAEPREGNVREAKTGEHVQHDRADSGLAVPEKQMAKGHGAPGHWTRAGPAVQGERKTGLDQREGPRRVTGDSECRQGFWEGVRRSAGKELEGHRAVEPGRETPVWARLLGRTQDPGGSSTGSRQGNCKGRVLCD